MTVRVGLPVPDVDFDYYQRGEGDVRRSSLSSYRGRWLVLFFYPRDFSFICPTEIAEFARLADEFARLDAEVVGASTDSYFTHKAWFETDDRLAGVNYPVIADTALRMSKAFDVLLDDGATLRGTFIVDPDGQLRHMTVNEHDVGRNVEEMLRVVQALQTGELCPVSWRPGQATLNIFDEHFASAFPRLSPKGLADATSRSRAVSFTAGQTIVEQGAAADCMYVVRSGEVEVLRRRPDGRQRVIATLGAGDHFGEIGLIKELRRTASVRARTGVELLELPLDAFRAIIESSEPVAGDMRGVVEGRLTTMRASDQQNEPLS